MDEIIKKLAALMYYDTQVGTAKDKRKSFEALDEHDQKLFLEEAKAVLVHLDKLDLMLAPRVTHEEADERRRTLKDRIETRIRDFVMDLKYLKRDMFPSMELAGKVMEEVER